MEEQTIFADDTVTITTARAYLNGTTYAMANITSVRTHAESRGVIKAIVAIVGLTVAASFVVGISSAVFFITLPLTVVAALWFAFSKPKLWVRIGTAGAESNALWSNDPAWVAKVVAAINEAIVRRG